MVAPRHVECKAVFDGFTYQLTPVPARVQCNARTDLPSGLMLWGVLCVCAWIYWPGLDGPPLLDDGANLRVIYSLEESPAYLADIVLGNKSGPLGRPLSMLSFGAEHIFAPNGIRGFKFHNLALHLIIGSLVVWLALCLFRIFAAESVPPYWAVLTGAMWLVTPAFVSTTLYIVQRMTQLSTLFCVLGLLCYVVGRTQLERGLQRGWSLIAAVLPCAAAAVLSKENGAVLLPLVMLVEWTAWRWHVAMGHGNTRALRSLHFAVAGLGMLALIAFAIITERSLLGGYVNRDFSLTERLMTQARVLWEYLILLLLPLRDGVGLFHDDYVISRGLLSPRSTLPALVGLVLVTGIAIRQLTLRRSAPAFGLLFFLCAHAVESTIIPLEMFFEHRNYLPAFGVYFCVAWTLYRLSATRAWTKPLIGAGIAVWLGVASIQTGLQSTVWSREMVLLLEAARAHPRSLRVHANLSALFARMGEMDAAMRYARQAAELDQPEHLRHSLRHLVLLCMANAALEPGLVQEIDARISTDALRDAGVSENMQVLVENFNRGACPRLGLAPVAQVFERLLAGEGNLGAAPRVYGLLAIMENSLGENAKADAYLTQWLAREPDAVQAWMIRLTLASEERNAPVREQALAQLRRLQLAGRVTREQREDIELLEKAWFDHAFGNVEAEQQ